METAALFGSSVGLVFGIGIGLLVGGLFLRGKGGPSNRAGIFGFNNAVNQNITVHANPPSAPQGDSLLSRAGNFSTVVGLVVTLLQALKIFGA
jgi:hypothetical protein